MTDAQAGTPVAAMSRRIDTAPLTTAHLHVFVAAALGYLFDGFDGSSLSFFLPVIRAQWSLSATVASLVASSTAQGYLVGSLAAGLLADRYGRKPLILWSLAIYAFASIMSAASQGWHSYFIMRFLCGVGTGAEAVTLTPYLAEFLPARYRGTLCAAAVGFLSFGYFASSLLGYLVVSGSAQGWRVASLITALPVFILLYWRRSLPESPLWLASQGRLSDANAVLDRLVSCPALWKRTPRNATENPHPTQAIALPADDTPPAGLVLPAVCVCVIWTALFFSFYGFFTWLPSWYAFRNGSLAGGYRVSVAVFATQIPGYFVFAALGCIISQYLVLTLTFAVIIVFAALVHVTGDQGLQILCLCGISFGLAGGVGVVYAYTSALFPTRYRGTITGLAAAVSRAGAIAATFGLGLAFARWGYGILPSLILAPLLVALLAIIPTMSKPGQRKSELLAAKQPPGMI